MRRQKEIWPNKGQNKTVNRIEVRNLSDTEFKILVKKVFKKLSEDLNGIKKTQSEMKDILIEIKNNLQGINSKIDKAENQMSDLEHKEAKYNQSE